MFSLRLAGVISLCTFTSCTMILSTNIPGSPQKALPKEWQGTYKKLPFESPIPDKRDSAKSGSEFVTIEANRITWNGIDGSKSISLDDSLSYSKISDKSQYLSILMPQGLYAIFKVTKTGDTLNLYSLSSDAEIKKSELNKYFEQVEKMHAGKDEYYKVTLIDKKLDAYFKSGIPTKQVITLVPAS